MSLFYSSSIMNNDELMMEKFNKRDYLVKITIIIIITIKIKKINYYPPSHYHPYHTFFKLDELIWRKSKFSTERLSDNAKSIKL